MKTYTAILHYVILTLLIFMSNISLSQKKGFNKGYIVNLEGDTITGWVQDRNPGIISDIYEKIRFIKKGKKKKRKYSPNQIQGYGYNGMSFESIGLEVQMVRLVSKYYVHPDNEKMFLKLINKNDILTLYEEEYIYEQGESIDSYPLLYKNGSKQMVRVTQGVFGLKKKRLAEYFNDCSNLINAINMEQVTSERGVFDYYSNNCR